ncbi:hypothetical protein [Alloalcanivorax xenomutans]
MTDSKVVALMDHPAKFVEHVRQLCASPNSVEFSNNINDLAQAREVSMSQIWATLENGEVDGKVLPSEEGRHAKLIYEVAGELVTVDILVTNDDVLAVLYANADDEEA